MHEGCPSSKQHLTLRCTSISLFISLSRRHTHTHTCTHLKLGAGGQWSIVARYHRERQRPRKREFMLYTFSRVPCLSSLSVCYSRGSGPPCPLLIHTRGLRWALRKMAVLGCSVGDVPNHCLATKTLPCTGVAITLKISLKQGPKSPFPL